MVEARKFRRSAADLGRVLDVMAALPNSRSAEALEVSGWRRRPAGEMWMAA
jgi:hypothetical protein